MTTFRTRRWPCLLIALLCALPQLAWADPDYGGTYTLISVFAGVVLLLLAVGGWKTVKHVRAGLPGIGIGNGILMAMAALTMVLAADSWAGLVSRAYLGLSAWLLARKQLRQAEAGPEWWAAVGLVGFSWLANCALLIMPGYIGNKHAGEFSAQAGANLIQLAAQLLGWVPLIKAFYARQLVLWPAEAITAALRVAGRATALSLTLSLLLSVRTLVHPEYWREAFPPLLVNELVLGLSVLVVILGVAWWQHRQAVVR